VTSTRRSPTRVVYRNSGSRASSNRVYYNYEPRRRSFWDKHRDKLTVAMGTGGGALIGGLIGGLFNWAFNWHWPFGFFHAHTLTIVLIAIIIVLISRSRKI